MHPWAVAVVRPYLQNEFIKRPSTFSAARSARMASTFGPARRRITNTGAGRRVLIQSRGYQSFKADLRRRSISNTSGPLPLSIDFGQGAKEGSLNPEAPYRS